MLNYKCTLHTEQLLHNNADRYHHLQYAYVILGCNISLSHFLSLSLLGVRKWDRERRLKGRDKERKRERNIEKEQEERERMKKREEDWKKKNRQV